MNIAIILFAVIFGIPLGLGLGWALSRKELPEEIVPGIDAPKKKAASKSPAVDKQRLHKILASTGIHPTAKMTKPKLKTALGKIIKSDILFLAENHYGFTINKNLTKPIMIDAFINQLSAQQKKTKKNV
jgi:surfactin synthase thioesterase subunit